MTVAALNPFALAADRLQRTTSDYRKRARPEQLPPPGKWSAWYVRGGRGGGKTWTGSGAFAEMIRAHPLDPEGNPTEWGVVAPTFADARDICVENARSGLLRAFGLDKTFTGWNRSQGQLRLPGGQVIYADGADDGALRVQGKNLSGAWCDEIGLWRQWKTAWEESIGYAVRIRPAQIIATGTPKNNRDARKLIRQLLEDPAVPCTLLRTEDNQVNLDPDWYAKQVALHAGTRLGRQELGGELLDDVEGALWSSAWIEAGRCRPGDVPTLIRKVCSIDPAVTSSETADEAGIIIVGRGVDGEGYVLADLTRGDTPLGWAKVALLAAVEWECGTVRVEDNQGKEMNEVVLRVAWAELVAQGKVRGALMPEIKRKHATGSKRDRAAPVAAQYEAGRWHHVSPEGSDDLELLEDELTGWDGTGDSPNRLDALVHGAHELFAEATATLGETHARRPDQRWGRLAGRR